MKEYKCKNQENKYFKARIEIFYSNWPKGYTNKHIRNVYIHSISFVSRFTLNIRLKLLFSFNITLTKGIYLNKIKHEKLHIYYFI